MKVLYLVLKSSEFAHKTLEHLKEEGFNATVMSTESLRHAIDDFPEERHFYNLRHFENRELFESIFCMFVLSEARLEKAKSIVREDTKNFSLIHGFMFSRPVEDYEGSI